MFRHDLEKDDVRREVLRKGGSGDRLDAEGMTQDW